MGYCVYKLNLQPDILSMYLKNDDLDYLVLQEIPTVLENIAELKQSGSFFEIIIESQSTKEFTQSFEKLENMTFKLLDEYNKVLQNYRKNEDVLYSKKFLKLNEKCMDLRRNLEHSYTGIKKAFETISDEEVDGLYSIESDNQVGTGITHIRKFFKIKEFLSTEKGENSLKPLSLISYYNSQTEHILVGTEDIELANNYIDALEELINTSKDITSRIGKININPIYESIQLDGDYSEISYIIVYPNGNPPLERHNILQESEAKEIHAKLIGTDGKFLNAEPIREMLEEEARKGYLKKAKAKGKGFITKIRILKSKETDN
ncbi:hypothetical protein JZO73_03810 [Enterococcus plantarum]|uniref:hypothetical protein n=1 Tax=Enterococcus plantarum TaxID=1077675 RepID=UPI001A8F40C5|nr:hypothetical protein [Enterococcus plantarum]MBO0466655.1 hypothetical protein [Enterococcus plantarum]